jgi:hypothetical protein
VSLVRLPDLGGLVPRRLIGAAEDRFVHAVGVVLDARLTAAVVDRVLASDLVDSVAAGVARHRVAPRVGAPLLENGALDELVEALDTPAARELVADVIASDLVDEAVTRLLESEELWRLVDEIARSPAVLDAISHQGFGFADQVTEAVRGRSRNADRRLERAARRLVRRHAAEEPADGAGPVTAP